MDINAFFKVTYGLYIVSSMDGDKYNGHVNNTVFQIAAEPPRFAVASHKDNLTTIYIQRSKTFSVSIMKEAITMDFLGPWGFKSGKEIDKYKDCNYKIGKTGCPIMLDNAIAWIECNVIESIDTGTHILFIGNVADAELLQDDLNPLSYTYYRNVIKGLSPENAPTHVSKVDTPPEKDKSAEKESPASDKSKYKCVICGYLYDPAEGDPSKGIPAGTAFEDLPDDWTCPICGVGKNEFIKA